MATREVTFVEPNEQAKKSGRIKTTFSGDLSDLLKRWGARRPGNQPQVRKQDPPSPRKNKPTAISNAEKLARAKAITGERMTVPKTAEPSKQANSRETNDTSNEIISDDPIRDEDVSQTLPMTKIRSQTHFRPVTAEEQDEANASPNSEFQRLIDSGKWRPLSDFVVQKSSYSKTKRMLGYGRFGTVYLRETKETHEPVAMKKINHLDEKYLNRELLVMANLRHPALVSMIGYIPPTPDGSLPTIVMPYMSSGSCQRFVDAERNKECPPEWTPKRKHLVLYGVAVGMMFLHEQKIMHRDLKPVNILLDENMEPKIADFGLAKLIDSDHALAQTAGVGSPLYQAPEMICASDSYGLEVDVYSYAIVLYVIVTAQYPSRREYLEKLARGIYARPPLLKSMSDSYKTLIERLWQEDPKERPTFREIVEALGNPEFFPEFVTDPVFIEYQKKVAPEFVTGVEPETPQEEDVPVPVDPTAELKELADSGDPVAQMMYGDLLMSGDNGVEPDCATALQYYQASADQGHITAMVTLGNYYVKLGTWESFGKAAEYFTTATNSGDAVAQDALGTLYRYGLGVPRDETKAAHLFWQAATSGNNAEAHCHYGEMLEQGRGVLQNIPEAVNHYRKSSDNGFPEGMYNYADMLHHGRHVEKNVKEAAILYERAANAGYNSAFYPLCNLYLYGDTGIPPNPKRAARYAKTGVSRGCFISMAQLADMYRLGHGVRQNDEKVEELLSRARQPQFATEQNQYAYMLKVGKGCSQDLAKAKEWFLTSAENGCTEAMFNLGCLYRDGDGVDVDPEEAAKWVKQAADAGLDVAQYEYGGYLAEGNGVEADPAQALVYLEKAAGNQYIDAYRTIGRMIEKGQGCAASPEVAMSWYQRAVDLGDSIAYAFMGDLYERGFGVDQDCTEAARLYQLGVEGGSEMAMKRLISMYVEGRGIKRSIRQAKQTAEKGTLYGYKWAEIVLAWLKQEGKRARIDGRIRLLLTA